MKPSHRPALLLARRVCQPWRAAPDPARGTPRRRVAPTMSGVRSCYTANALSGLSHRPNQAAPPPLEPAPPPPAPTPTPTGGPQRRLRLPAERLLPVQQAMSKRSRRLSSRCDMALTILIPRPP
ncbi:hypothetical protein GQ55_5G439000 [Panicum hallii var. hallii]|uniref:Uncharacterized protein n=1 Tax=Panicum hallii var. hallii TaxID=1504633 RepID=A0A2T7DPL1_9POAL|nr:hypothetical protein GQ55_5G439000 [Panicum hallii var. hallii]